MYPFSFTLFTKQLTLNQTGNKHTTALIRSAILIYGPYVSFSSPYRTVTRHKEGAVAERKTRYTYIPRSKRM